MLFRSLDAFRLARTLGATGLASAVWVTRDGEVVLHRDAVVRRGLRQTRIADLRREELPSHVPALRELIALPGEWHLGLEVAEPAALAPLLRELRSVGGLGARTWLHHADPSTCATWVRLAAHDDGPRVVHAERIGRMSEGVERRLARVADDGVAAVSMLRDDWSGGLVALAHRFGLEAFASDVRFAHQAAALLAMGCDAIGGDWPDRLVDGRDGRVGREDA